MRSGLLAVSSPGLGAFVRLWSCFGVCVGNDDLVVRSCTGAIL